MTIIQQSQKLLESYYAGHVNTRQFHHGLNRLITVRAEEPTTVIEVDGQYVLQTTDAKLIPNIIDSDATIIAKSFDDNGFIDKVRAIIPPSEVKYIEGVAGGS